MRVDDGEARLSSDGDELAARFGEIGFLWARGENSIRMVRASADGFVPAMVQDQRQALLAHLAPSMEDGEPCEFNIDAFRLYCETFLRKAAKAPIIDVTSGEEPVEASEAVGTTTEPATPVRSYLSDGGAVLAGLVKFAAENEGSLGIGWGTATKEWSVSLTFGREAEDSPMAGGQALGIGASLQDALVQVAEEAHIEPVPLDDSAPPDIEAINDGDVAERDRVLRQVEAPVDPPYPADLLDHLAGAVAAMMQYDQPIGTSRRERAINALDRYTVEVGRENVPEPVARVIGEYGSGS